MRYAQPVLGAVGGVVLASSLLFGAVHAQATVPAYQPPQHAATAARTTPAPSATKRHYYSDSEVVDLVVFAQGPIAEKHPALAARIQGNRPKADVSPGNLKAFTAGLKRVDPKFHQVVTIGVQRNDPYTAQVAMKRLSADISLWTKQQKLDPRTALDMRADGWFWHDSYVLTEQNLAAVWQAAAYTTVAGAAEAVVVVAIVPAAASYQFEMNKADQGDVQGLVADVTRAAG
jgi:SdpC family antimicrobial peptide